MSLLSLSTIDDLENLCALKVAEGLNLEFKLKDDPSVAVLSKNDKRAIAKAISAFANSDGGVLVYGIRSQRTSGSDVATELIPIAAIDHFVAEFRTVCALNINPTLLSTKVESIPSRNGDGSGFLACSVARSDMRPHMSVATDVHRYYRRSFEGSVPMTPSEIRDQILAIRDAVLEPVIVEKAGGSFSNNRGIISGKRSIRFHLKNSGRALCKNPFLRIGASCALYSHAAHFDHHLNVWKTDFAPGTLVHIEDQIDCMGLYLNLIVRADLLQRAFEQNSDDLGAAVYMMPGAAEHHVSTVTDKVSLEEVVFTLRYGAENAPVSEQIYKLRRDQFAAQLLAEQSVRDMLSESIGGVRADLLDAFTARHTPDAV